MTIKLSLKDFLNSSLSRSIFSVELVEEPNVVINELKSDGFGDLSAIKNI
jgi:hypothetical protein